MRHSAANGNGRDFSISKFLDLRISVVRDRSLFRLSQASHHDLRLDPSDYRLKYKLTGKDVLKQVRREAGTFEAVFERPDGKLTEGSYTNIFVEKEGKLLTPPLERGLLPGLLRQRLIDEGKAEEADLTVEDLGQDFLIGNMVRGLLKARLA